MHVWIQHPLGAVTTLASAGQDPAQGSLGSRQRLGVPTLQGPRRELPAGAGMGKGMFSLPQPLSASGMPRVPWLLVPLVPAPAVKATLGHARPCARGWVAAKHGVLARASPCPRRAPGWGIGLVLGCPFGPFRRSRRGDAPAALALRSWFAAKTWVSPGWGAAPAGAAGAGSPVPPVCLQACRAGGGTLFTPGV